MKGPALARNLAAERHAGAVLATLGVVDVPVDPIAIAGELGIEVYASVLESDVAGMLTKRSNGSAEIYLNRFDPSRRQRFTCAHELGHFYLHKIENGAGREKWDYVDYRDDLASTGRDPNERYANSFAAALLMPESHVRKFHSAAISPSEMANLFEVSRQAMQYRLDNLELH